MQDQLVSFKVAKLAKEKGFDNIHVDVYYHINKGYTLGYAMCISEVNKQTYGCLLAPTQSLLQKWLRDKHEIHIFVIPCEPSSYSKYKDLSVVWIYDIYKPLLVEYGHSNKGDNLLSYEQALDEGLYEALTLIKSE